MNENVYFAYLTAPKSDQHALARMIDEYWNWVLQLSVVALMSGNGAHFCLVRDSGCDIKYGEMVLQTAPGDAMGTLS